MIKRLPGAELVLPATIVLAAILLGISEFMTTFQFTPPNGEPLRESLAADRHSYALLFLAVGTVIAMILAIATGVRTASIATAVLGCSALLLFLLLDLPDAGKLGDLEDPVFGLANVRADPQAGFWVEAIGSVVLGLASVAFATLRPEQLRAPIEVLQRDTEARREALARRRHEREGVYDADTDKAAKPPKQTKPPEERKQA